jgi:hypothetical protein
MNNRRNILLFLRLLMSDPAECFDRAEVILQAKKEKRLARKGRFTAYPESIPFAEVATCHSPLCTMLTEPSHF